jgi:hypothetical protein
MKRREFVVTSSFGLVAMASGVMGQDKKKYVCPPCGCGHDGEVHDETGQCPSCGMALVEKTAAMSEITAIPNFLKLNEQVWTGGQPTMEHLSKLKEGGVKVILNLRPHAEHNGGRE